MKSFFALALAALIAGALAGPVAQDFDSSDESSELPTESGSSITLAEDTGPLYNCVSLCIRRRLGQTDTAILVHL